MYQKSLIIHQQHLKTLTQIVSTLKSMVFVGNLWIKRLSFNLLQDLSEIGSWLEGLGRTFPPLLLLHTLNQHLEIRNQDTFIMVITPPPSLHPPRQTNDLATHVVRSFDKSIIIPFTEPLPGQLQQNCSYRKSHSLFRLGKIIKGNFFIICRKMAWKNTDLCLKTLL